MARGSVAVIVRRATALATATALLAATPVVANAAGLSLDDLKDAVDQTKPSSGSSSSAPTRRPPSSKSEIDVKPNKQTEAFRKELAARQKRLDDFMAQLDALDRELEVATEEYNSAVDKLSETREHVLVAQGDLDKARSAYDVQEGILGDRASSMYKDGSLAVVEMLLGSESMSDFIARVKFLNTIGIRDADIAASLKGQKDLLEKRVNELEDAQAVAQSLEFELKARQIEILLRIQERQDMLAEAQTDLLQLLDQEAARRTAQEQQLLNEILSGANKKGIVAEPGSPVETALAYHGVPYLWGGETTSGFDCSGLVLYVFRQHGVELPHYSGSQFRLGEKVAAGAMNPGDAVFFGSPIHHVGIYMGGGYYIHAPRTGDFVKISRLADRSDFAGARRYAWQVRVGEPKNAVKSTTEALQSYKVNGR